MTRDEIEKLSDEELNSKIAIEVMGWQGYHDIHYCEDPWYNYCRNIGCHETGANNEYVIAWDYGDAPLPGCKGYPGYASDIAAAWEVVEKISKNYNITIVFITEWMVNLWIDYDQTEIAHVSSHTLPRAISIAALLAKMQP